MTITITITTEIYSLLLENRELNKVGKIYIRIQRSIGYTIFVSYDTTYHSDNVQGGIYILNIRITVSPE